MADQEKNVKVNWIVDTKDVERAKNLMAQADQVANKFQQTAAKGGNDLAGAFKTSQTSVDSMRLRLKEVKTIMETLPVTATKRLATYSAEYKKLDAEIRKVTRDLYQQEKASKAVNSSAVNTAKSFGQVLSAVRLIIAAGLVRETINTSLEMAKLSGNVEGVERAFQRAFPGAQLLLSELRQSTRGTVSDFKLMQRTLQATNLGVSAQHLGVLFEFAATRAQQTGESVDYLVDSIVRGIGRKSILVLDNLGLSATRLREQFNGAAIASKSVAEVTEGVAEIARVELGKMGGFAETSATKVDQLTVSWKDLGKEISTLATQDGGLIDFFKSYTESFKLLIEAQNKGISVSELATRKQRDHNAEFSANLFFQTAFTKNKEENIKVLEAEIARLTRSVGAWGNLKNEMEDYNSVAQEELDILKQTFIPNKDKMIALAQEIDFRKDLINVKRAETLEDQEVLKLLLLRLAAMKEVKGVEEQLGLIAAKQEQIKAVTDALPDAKSTTKIHNLNIELAKLNGELADLKAFGTTKQFLEVNGQIKLVPVIDPKGFADAIKQTPLLQKNSNPVTKEFLTIDGKIVVKELDVSKVKFSDKGRSATDQMQEDVDLALKNMELQLQLFGQSMIVPPQGNTTRGNDFFDWFETNWQETLDVGLDQTSSFVDAATQAEIDGIKIQIAEKRAYYDELHTLAGDNEKFKDRLRLRENDEIKRLQRQQAEREKKAALAGILVSTALGVIKVFAGDGSFYEKIARALVVAAEGATQYGIASNAKYFAKGGINIQGPGTKTSDSINARLSKGESVMTADETQSAGGILKDIRAGRLNDRKMARQLDANVLKDLKLSKNGVTYAPGMSDTRIVSRLDQLIHSQPDFEEKSGVLWKTRKKSENYKQWVRAKIM